MQRGNKYFRNEFFARATLVSFAFLYGAVKQIFKGTQYA